MINSIYKFLQAYPWLTWGSLLAVIMVVSLIRRIRKIEASLPTEVKLSWRLNRAAKGMRKLGGARRIQSRCVAIYSVFPWEPWHILHRLLRAKSNARDAVYHLSGALEQLSKLGCSPSILTFLDHRIMEAKSIKATCSELYRNYTKYKPFLESKEEQELIEPWHELELLLNQTTIILDEWREDLINSKTRLLGTVDSVILRSGGVLRNPLKRDCALENSQSESVIDLRESKDDLYRVKKCVDRIQQCLPTLQASKNIEQRQYARILGQILDEIDYCLVRSKLPLPVTLVTGETPSEDESKVQKGLLQEIYEILLQVEIVAWANFAGSKLKTI